MPEPSTHSTSSVRSILRNWADPIMGQQHEEKLVFVLTLMIGAIVGLMVVAFIVVTENLGSRMYPAGGAAWRRVLIPAMGALITGFLLRRYFPNARGSGIPQTKTALFLHGGLIRFRTVLGKFSCSSVSLASGIALGREGPSVQVGAGIASALGRRVGLGPNRIKSLVPIGASAALAAAFNTPIAAVLFTLEEVMGDLHAPVLGAIVLSSATSWMVLHLVLGDEPLFHVPAYQLVHPIEFAVYALLGLAGGLVSVSFVRTLLWMRKHFLRMPAWTSGFQPLAGGLTVGILGWFVPDVLGVGYNHVSQALNGQLALRTMALLVALKLIATTTCYASGNAGGIFGPSLFIGAMMGGAVGGAAHMILPDYTGGVGAYALVGMGAAFAGIIRVPLTSVIMIFEITRDYSIIVPLMIANLISYYISSKLQEEPIYESLLHQDGIHLPPGARSREDLLAVSQGARPAAQVFDASDTVEHVLATANGDQSAWPVVDTDGLLGMITRAKLREMEEHGRLSSTVGSLFAPLMPPWTSLTAESFPHVHPDQPLDTAMRRMAQSELNVLPVVSRSNPRELVGIISRNDALSAYGSRLSATESDHKNVGTSAGLLAGIVVVLICLVALAGFLNYYYREERSARAKQYYTDAVRLMSSERYQEAIQQFRNALSISHAVRDRLALAQALEKAGRSGEAEIYFRELLREAPGSGPANLGLARVAVSLKDIDEAVKDYNRAIYGAWPDNAQTHRLDTRIELIGALGKFGKRREAQAQLLSLAAEIPDDRRLEKRVAHMQLDYGLPRDAAEMYRRVLASDRKDVDALTGLGEAELAQGDYRAAESSFRSALAADPGNSAVSRRLEIAEKVVALDPTLRGVNDAERYRRSRKVLEAALGRLDECLGTVSGATPETITDEVDKVRQSLLRHGRPASYGQSADQNIRSAEELWKARGKLCGPSKTPDEPLDRVMRMLAP